MQHDNDPSASVGQLLGRLTRRWKANLDERLKFTGLTQARWHAMIALSKAGEPITQRELAERISVEPSTLVRHLDALAAQGLVERIPEPGDRRANLVRLTESAGPLIGQMTEIADALRHELVEGVPHADIVTCVRVLSTMADRLERA
jgi:MarR family transcriptional regulator for hemolysin